jgi:hypothetical protein
MPTWWLSLPIASQSVTEIQDAYFCNGLMDVLGLLLYSCLHPPSGADYVNGSQSLLVIMNVMVWHIMGNSHEVITTQLSYCLQNVGVEISLQSHGYSFCMCLFPFLQLVKHISLYAHMCLLSERVSGVSFRYLISHCSSFDSHKQFPIYLHIIVFFSINLVICNHL